MVSRGLIGLCRSEDDLAAVLAHEVGHVQLEHGLKAIKKGRMGEVAGLLATEAAGELAPGGLGKLVGLFNESIGDVIKNMVVNGYSREQELEADYAALVIMNRVGYPPSRLIDVLDRMKERFSNDKKGFAKTHPSPQDRIERARGYLPPVQPQAPPKPRMARYEKALAK